jgi:hypothetical protein
MKLHSGTHTVEKSGNFEESKFSIEASAKAFFILSDGLYSNKILAVVRELSTNAYDSHVEAGKVSVPFDVHLPTQLDPTFSIRDYGTSMDHDNCMQLYTTYFRSTRNNSNEAVGCLGLGSKAPFAYADSFTVEAYLNGQKRLYTGYKNEDGSPTFSLLDEMETSEPNGIKVSINVASHDVGRFVGEAKKVYEFFKVRPNFIGEKIQYTSPAKVLEGDSWYFDDNANNNLIIMGQIAYPLDHYQIMNADADNAESKFVQYSDGLRIFVNIGDVDITPSRESLSYSNETKVNIRSKVKSIASEIAIKIEAEIKSQPTLFKARKKYAQISDQCSSIKSAIESLQKSIMWNDMKLFDSVAGESIEIKNKITCTTFSKNHYRKKIDTEYNTERMHFGNHTKFVVDDLPRGGISRLKQYMREEEYGSISCYVYKLAGHETVDSCLLYVMMGEGTKEDVILTSSLPKVEYNRQSSGGSSDSGPAIQAQVFNEETGRFEPCNMSVKYENAHYFIEAKDEVKIGYSDVDSNYLAHVLSWVHQNYNDAVGDATFYMVKPSVAKNRKLNERNNWTNGCKLLNEVFADAVEKHRDGIISVYSRCQLSNHRNDRWIDVIKLTKTNNRAKQIVAEYNEYTSKIDSIASDMHIIQTMAQKLHNVTPVNFSNVNTFKEKFASEFDNEMKKYIMLKVATGIWSDSDRKIVADYIDGIENNNNTL